MARGASDAERVSANDVTPGFLQQLGVNVALGRTFVAADVGQPVVVLSDTFWRAKLGADGHARWKRDYRIDAVTRQWVDLYREVLTAPSTAG